MKEFFSLLSKIQRNEFSPLYLLSGSESFFIDATLKVLMEKLSDEKSNDFDLSVFYGKEAKAIQILECAKRYPMLSKHNTVVLKDAQLINTNELDVITSYAQNPNLQTILIICYKNKIFDKRKKLFKAIEKNGDVLLAKPIYENKLNSWIQRQAEILDIKISPLATELLAGYVGSNLGNLDQELKKLKIIVKDEDVVTEEHIEKYLGISKESYCIELQKAIGIGNFSKAFQIIQFLNRNSKDHPLVLVLSNLYNYFKKLLLLKGVTSDPKVLGINPFFISEYSAAAKRLNMRQISLAMDHIMEADLKSKGINTNNATYKQTMEELLLKLFTL